MYQRKVVLKQYDIDFYEMCVRVCVRVCVCVCVMEGLTLSHR